MRFSFGPYEVRLDAAALRETLAAVSAMLPLKAAAGGGALLATATIVYAIWPASTPPAPVDAVVTTQTSVFTPVTWKPAAGAPAPAAAAPEGDEDVALPPAARDPTALVRDVQRELKRAGCYRGRIDGRWNAATRNAMAAFTEIVNARLPVDVADPVLLVLLETHPDAACGRPGGRAEEFATLPPETARLETAAAQREPEAIENEPSRVTAPERRVAAAEPEDEPVPAQPGVSTTEAAAVAAAAAVTTQKVARADRPHVKRKYRKKNSFSRTVSRNFRKLQRGLRFFW